MSPGGREWRRRAGDRVGLHGAGACAAARGGRARGRPPGDRPARRPHPGARGRGGLGGAFYAWPDITQTGLAADVLAERLLEEAGVAVLSGTAFGLGGEGHLRLSCAAAPERLREGLARMSGLLASSA